MSYIHIIEQTGTGSAASGMSGPFQTGGKKMIILICDDDKEGNAVLSEELRSFHDAEILTVDSVQECRRFLEGHSVDWLFLSLCSEKNDFRMLLTQLRAQKKVFRICLMGIHEDDSVNVYTFRCEKFLKKPYAREEIRECMEYMSLISSRRRNVTVRTFGSLDVFVNDVPVLFRNAKARELFALCVDHAGGLVSIYEAVEKLWPDRGCDEKTKRLYRKAVMSIHFTLNEYRIEKVFTSVRGGCSVNASEINCDFFSFLKNPRGNLSSLNGKYLTDYAWSEETLAKIIRTAQSVSNHKELEYLYE